jgi:5-methyltetrahydrofolate--homocysteine methyltransferase
MAPANGNELLGRIANAVLEGDAPTVEQLTKEALDSGVAPQDVLNVGMIGGLNVVGEKFKINELYVPEVLIAARAMKAGMTILKPRLVASGVKPVGKFMIGTVKGDLHDIGKNLVGMMLEGAGFEVIDIGVDVGPEKFVQEIVKHQPSVVGMSALLTTTMLNLKPVIDELHKSCLRDMVKVVIGGAPVTKEYAAKIGADGYATDAATAVSEVRRLMGL